MTAVASPEGGFQSVTYARVERQNNTSRAALAAAFTALVACTLLAVTHRGGSGPTALTGWIATGRAGPTPFYEPPAEAAAQGGVSGANSNPFHSNGANYGTGSAAGPLDGKNVQETMPKYLMQPKWAAREGREAAGHALAQPFLVPLEANGMPVAGADITPLGEYAPKTPQYTNPLAQYIPNVTYVADGDDVVGFEGPADVQEDAAAEEQEEAAAEEQEEAAMSAEEGAGEEPVTSEEKQLDMMKTALRSVEVNKGGVKDLIARLETAEAKQEAVAGAFQRKAPAMAKLSNDLYEEEALLKEHNNAAARIRQKMAVLRGVARRATLQGVEHPPQQPTMVTSQPEIRPRIMNAGQYTNGMQNTISPIYSAPASVTAGAVEAMKQADIIHQNNMRFPQQAQVQVTSNYQ